MRKGIADAAGTVERRAASFAVVSEGRTFVLALKFENISAANTILDLHLDTTGALPVGRTLDWMKSDHELLTSFSFAVVRRSLEVQ